MQSNAMNEYYHQFNGTEQRYPSSAIASTMDFTSTQGQINRAYLQSQAVQLLGPGKVSGGGEEPWEQLFKQRLYNEILGKIDVREAQKNLKIMNNPRARAEIMQGLSISQLNQVREDLLAGGEVSRNFMLPPIQNSRNQTQPNLQNMRGFRSQSELTYTQPLLQPVKQQQYFPQAQISQVPIDPKKRFYTEADLDQMSEEQLTRLLYQQVLLS